MHKEKTLIFLALMLLAAEYLFCQIPNISPLSHLKQNSITNYSYLRDTLYTLREYYLEVNLSTQTGYLHKRDCSVDSFGVSTGNSRIKDAIETKEGIFTVQSKLPQWYSIQFDSTQMLNWIGFNFGIGFHSLPSNGYYRYLGVRKSSHGCIRISREMSIKLYKIIDIGTPVIIHSGHNVVVIDFAKLNQRIFFLGYNVVCRTLQKRLNALYSGRFFLEPGTALFIDKINVLHSGLDTGDSRKILKRQITGSVHNFVYESIPHYKNLMLIKTEQKREIFFDRL